MFSEIIHHIILSKYTLECTQLNYLLKIFLEEHTLESSINKIEQRYTHSTINNARGMYYNTTSLAKKLHPLFGHRFLPLKKNDHLFRHPPPPPLVMIVYVTIMPCQRSHKRKIPTTPLLADEPIIMRVCTIAYSRSSRGLCDLHDDRMPSHAGPPPSVGDATSTF